MNPWPYPHAIAHRGGGTLAPENTLAAMRAGARRGYRMVEFDAKLTHDGVIVLMHDDGLERTTNGHGPVADTDWSTISSLDAGGWMSREFAGEPVPRLEHVAPFLIANELVCNIEIKPCPGREIETGETVARAALTLWHHASAPPLLSSFSEAALRAAARTAPSLPRGVLFGEPPVDAVDRARDLGSVSMHFDHRFANEEVIARAHGEGLRVLLYTVNDAARARTLLDWGADGFFTDALEVIPADS